MDRKLRSKWNFIPITVAALTSAAEVSATPTFQWSPANGGNGHSYMATDTPTTWTEANAQAAALGGYLVSVTSSTEQAFLVSTFLSGGSAGNTNLAFWTGLNDADTEGTFKWTSGEPFTYNNWSSGEPNNYTGGISSAAGEDYVVLNWSFANGLSGATQGQWNDTPNSGCNQGCLAAQIYRSIIEFDAPPTPVTPADLLSINLSASPAAVAVGDVLTYTALITNSGTETATGVRLSVTLPDSVTVVTTSGGCNTDPSRADVVQCDIASIAAGASIAPTIVVKAALPGSISAAVSVSAAQADPNPATNSATLVATVTGAAGLPAGDLAISFGGPRNVRFKSKPTFSLTIKNRSTIPVSPVMVSGQFPDNVKLNVKLPRFCTRNDANLVRCTILALPPRFSKTFRLKAKATRRAVVATTATISSSGITDSDPSNNVAPIRVTVR